jgi:hypothetical protein
MQGSSLAILINEKENSWSKKQIHVNLYVIEHKNKILSNYKGIYPWLNHCDLKLQRNRINLILYHGIKLSFL